MHDIEMHAASEEFARCWINTSAHYWGSRSSM